MSRQTATKRLRPPPLAATGLVFAFCSLFFAAVRAAVIFNVNSLADTHAAIPASGTGLDNTSHITLRSALEASDATNLHGVTIVLPAGEIDLSLGQLAFGNVLDTNITIIGATNLAGAPASTIKQTDHVNRIADLDSKVVGNVHVALQNIVLTGGFPTNGGVSDAAFGGGAILGGGTNDSLAAINCIFATNAADVLDSGGAISWSGGGNLSLQNCAFIGNTASMESGGAISFANGLGFPGNLTVTGCTFLHNKSTQGSANSNPVPGSGGALFASLDPISASSGAITGCWFDSNQAESADAADPGQGGAINSQSSAVTISQCTFTNNSAQLPLPSGGGSGQGGAIYNSATTLTVTYCRFVSNAASRGLVFFQGGPSTNSVPFGSATFNYDWWSSNSGPGPIVTLPASGGLLARSGSDESAPAVGPLLQLELTASPADVATGSNTLIIADFLTDSVGNPVSPANLGALAGVPILFSGPAKGILSNVQQFIQTPGTATATFTGISTGTGGVTATVDASTLVTPVFIGPPFGQLLATRSNTMVQLTYTGIAGQNYVLQSASKAPGPYGNLSPTLPADSSGLVQFSDPLGSPSAARFYRAKSVP